LIFQLKLPDEELFDIDTKGDADEEEGPSEKDGKKKGKAKEIPQRKSVLDDFDPNDPQLKEVLNIFLVVPISIILLASSYWPKPR